MTPGERRVAVMIALRVATTLLLLGTGAGLAAGARPALVLGGAALAGAGLAAAAVALTRRSRGADGRPDAAE